MQLRGYWLAIHIVAIHIKNNALYYYFRYNYVIQKCNYLEEVILTILFIWIKLSLFPF